MNYPLLISLIAILLTQLLKYPIAYLFNRDSLNIHLITSTGGMPSSHSAAVTSLITSLIFEYGFSSPAVAIATVFGVIVMFDSMGVRRQSGEQGIVLDILAREHLKNRVITEQSLPDADVNPTVKDYHLDRYDDLIIHRYLGHKPTEVIAGAMTGMLIAIIARWIYIAFIH